MLNPVTWNPQPVTPLTLNPLSPSPLKEEALFSRPRLAEVPDGRGR